MRIVLLLLLIFYSSTTVANMIVESTIITSLQINQLFDEENKIISATLVDYIDREEKVLICSKEYIKKQSKTYTKKAQENLYDLIHNFDGIVSRIYGKKALADNIPHEDKLEVLAKLQCEAYYKMGILK